MLDDFLKIDTGSCTLDIDPWFDEDYGFGSSKLDFCVDEFDDLFDVDPLLDEFNFVGEFS